MIRAKDPAAAKSRLLATYAKRDLLQGDSSWIDRIVCYAGDVSETLFGLSPADHLMLVGQTDVVVHCGAEVNMIKPYQVLAEANVTLPLHCRCIAVACIFPEISEVMVFDRGDGLRSRIRPYHV